MHVVDLEAICGVPDPAAAERGHGIAFEFDERTSFGRLWGMVLPMAVRDRAASVHYHPWRESGALSYIVDNIRYVLMPPSSEWAGRMIDEARKLFTPAAGGWFRRSGPACATVGLNIGGNRLVWDAVVWSSGLRAGVELFRVTPLE